MAGGLFVAVPFLQVSGKDLVKRFLCLQKIKGFPVVTTKSVCYNDTYFGTWSFVGKTRGIRVQIPLEG